jgi:hypothetical protein
VNLVDIARTIRGNGKNKINDLVAVRKNKNIKDTYRGINEFKNGHQPRIDLKSSIF